jgi:hypothetical protein
MAKNAYTLYVYNYKGSEVVSAIHFLDVANFLSEHPDAKPFKREAN